MSYVLIKCMGQYVNANHKEFIINSASDVSSLPGLDECAPGSTATIIGGATYMLSIAGQWKSATTSIESSIASLQSRVAALENQDSDS